MRIAARPSNSTSKHPGQGRPRRRPGSGTCPRSAMTTTMIPAKEADRPFRSDIPARLDRLPWSRWHWLVVVALGITWVIDGLEVTLVGAISTVLVEPGTLHLSARQVGYLNAAYLVGAVLGAMFFGYLTDRL